MGARHKNIGIEAPKLRDKGAKWKGRLTVLGPNTIRAYDVSSKVADLEKIVEKQNDEVVVQERKTRIKYV